MKWNVLVSVIGSEPPKNSRPIKALGYIVDGDNEEIAKNQALICAEKSKVNKPRLLKNATFSICSIKEF